jgi:hypothetical protein
MDANSTKPERVPYLADDEYVLFDFKEVRFRVKFRKRSWREKNKKSRMYVDLPEDAGDTILDGLFKRDRGEQTDEMKARRKAMRDIAREAHENLGHDHKGLKYSAYAGCSMCPCSPGIVMNHDYGGDFYVESLESIRVRIDHEKEYAVDRAKENVTKHRKKIKDLEKKLAKAKKDLPKVEAKVGEAKEALRARREKRKAQKAAA